ncbi:MAG: alpha-amylase [Chloroherpetonaceae bacterium]|nr:alpha-amylase [Chloroherpetonaceae bacterium]
MSLQKVVSALKNLNGTKGLTYYVPKIWKGQFENGKESVNPQKYYTEAIQEILAKPKESVVSGKGGEWSKNSVIYNLFVRTTTAFDHNGNGTIDLISNPDPGSPCFRETGTFLKSIALLPHIKKLGATVVHLLPITAIGRDGNKGSLGSPYAIKNPYKLDDALSEPILGLTVEEEFKAFVEACHHLGLRVVVEFVFRTSAKDGDWVKEHPEWFYWIDDRVENRPSGAKDEGRYGNPIFTPIELSVINAKVAEGDFSNLPEPHPIYRSFFTPTPTTVQMKNGQYIGTTEDGRQCRIPGAFADWPPDDTQPPWGDVTYLKMYDHPDFNYIAYNTIRMYSTELAREEFANKPLWDKIIGIIPYYQETFGIDGVMIDMGHALPSELKKKMVAAARKINPDFAFWDENFDITHKSREEGYNAVIGSIPFVGHKTAELKKFLAFFGEQGIPVPFFGTAESHNTPRNASRFGDGEIGRRYAKFMFALTSVIPAIPFIHSGSEIAEWYPINTGIGFSPEELNLFPSEKLPLFSEYAYDWEQEQRAEFAAYVAMVMKARSKHLEVITDTAAGAMRVIGDVHHPVLILTRKSKDRILLFVSNTNFYGTEEIQIPLDTKKKSLKDEFEGRSFELKGNMLSLMLPPGESALFEL